MKKSVSILSIILLLALTNFVASQCPSTTGKHGVIIGGICFDCGKADGICPIEFGVTGDCLDPDCPEFAYWSANPDGTGSIVTNEDSPLKISLVDGRTLYVVARNTGKSGLEEGDVVTFSIKERDVVLGVESSDDITSATGTVDEQGTAVGTYEINDFADLNEGESEENNAEGVLELFFITSTGVESEHIFVNASYEAVEIGGCGDYLTESECNNDTEFKKESDTSESSECVYTLYEKCAWINTTSECGKDVKEIAGANNSATCRQALVPCLYAQSEKIGDCSAGEDFFKISYVPAKVQEGCVAYTTGPIPCPQQLKVPFFEIYEFITSLCIISIIYFLLLKRESL